MKIIHQGQRPDEQTHQGTCLHCRTVVEFQRGEAEFVGSQREGDSLTVNCPTCHSKIWTAL
jgi:hypothetical protein